MKRFVRILRKIFFLPPLPTTIIAVFGYVFVLAVAIFKIEISALRYFAYIASAYGLTVTITGFPYLIALIKRTKRRLFNCALMKKFCGTAFGSRFFGDIRFRTELSLYGALFVNFLYVGLNLFSGIIYRSVWFISLAAYYFLLAVMRFILVHKNKRAPEISLETEIKRCKMCGMMLLVMNQALAVIVIFMIGQNKGFNYPGVLIYAMAAYSFYLIIAAVVNLVKFGRHKSPLMSVAKVINLVAAMVSILSLETAMLARFGGDDDPLFRKVMTGTTGGGVCIAVIFIAVFMIWKSARQLKALKIAVKGETQNEQ